ncbi:MAG: OmpA family protein [Muribaculaceae bacterium]|nr:OmpA family protein [Muribaculaceae bacterium]
MKKFICLFMSAMLLISFSGCNSMSKTLQGGLLGGGGGAAVGAGIGALIGKGKGAAIGGAIGAVAGGVAGTLIGKHMQKKADELAAIQGASVSTVTDNNGFTGIQVTFDEGILFDTGKYALKTPAKNALTRFATSLKNDPNTNVQIFGHTDNTGSRAVNEKLSKQRADAVLNYLQNNGVASSRMESYGLAYDYPVASNDTKEGRAQNRRVEVYITADDTMIQQAEAGTLQ